MLFPKDAQTKIANTFYDKTVEVLESQETIDAEGGVVRTGDVVKSTFTGNVRFVSYGEQQSDKGLLKDIDIVVTCPADTSVELGDMLRYQGIKYDVVSAISSDSHKELQGQKWQSTK